MTSGNTTYEFIRFAKPRAQAGVVVAHPPSVMCPITPMIVAVAWDLSMSNPTVHFMHGETTVGMMTGVVNAIGNMQLGRYSDMANRIGAFSNIAHMLGINIHDYPETTQLVMVSQCLLKYLEDELGSYENA